MALTISEKAALAERAARAAGEMLEHHGSFKIRRKSENDFVTEMDLKSEVLIRDMLLSACPEDQFFGEETGGAAQAAGRWIVDPIDGTANFMRGERTYTISIAYEHEGRLEIGCVYCPGTDEMFLGVRGAGAACNGRPLHVSDCARLRDAVVHMGFGHRSPELMRQTMRFFPALMERISDVRRYASAAYDLCCVASGRCDAFLEEGLGIYDYAAGCVVLSEAGGTISGWREGDDGISTGNILGSNGKLHGPLREILNP